jgi:hypothetical protein
MTHTELTAGDLRAVVGDNAEDGDQHAGYNGLWRLTHAAQPRSPFLPGYAGMNLELILDGRKPEVIFEPRQASMSLRRLGDDAAQLHQPPTTVHKLESWTTFRLVPPHYVDFTFRCVARAETFCYDYIALFWASYIDGPLDKSVYLLGSVGDHVCCWQQLCTPAHGVLSTVCRHGHAERLRLAYDFEDRLLVAQVSPITYHEPFFYGNWLNMTLLWMFDADHRLRMAHSPSGGGYNPAMHARNPAWDYQFIIPDYRINEEYEFGARLVYRPTMTRDQILDEYHNYKSPCG